MGINMQKLMKQAQKMQADMARAQEELKEITVEGASGGGMVKVTVNGKGEPLSIKIDPQVVDPEDVEILEDMVLAAFLDAMRLAGEASNEKIQKITGGIPGGLPGGLF